MTLFYFYCIHKDLFYSQKYIYFEVPGTADTNVYPAVLNRIFCTYLLNQLDLG
jgi:hypothetical protein